MESEGIYLLVGGSQGSLAWASSSSLSRLLGFAFWWPEDDMVLAKMNQDDLLFLSNLLESGELVPVIEATYSLEETAHALRRLRKGHARGKLVITM